MSRTRHKLPDNLNPADDICYPLFVPNDPQWIRYLIRQIRTLTFDRHWERDENDGQDTMTVRRAWDERTLLPLLDAIQAQENCGDSTNLSACFRMDTSTEAFTFYPNDPFTDDPGIQIAVPLRWRRWENTDVENTPIWQGIEDIISFLTGYYPNDCILTPSNPITNPILNWSGFLSAITNFPFPYVRIDMEGTGQFEVELVNVPFGCSVWIIPDEDITNWQGILDLIIDFIDFDGELPAGWIITEVDRDLSIPPEVAATQTQEVEFNTEGDHNVTIIYVPRLDDEIPFIFPFGGIREMEACGNIKVIGSQTGELIGKNEAGNNDHKRKGVIPVTTTSELCEAVECGIINVFQRAIVGQSGNVNGSVTINPDGSVSIGTGTGTPTTQTGQEQLSGSALKAATEVRDFIEEIQDFYDNGDTQAFIKTKLELLYLIDDPTTAIANYDSFRQFPNGRIAPLDIDILTEKFFCEGIDKPNIIEYIIDDYAIDVEQAQLFDFIAILQQDQLDIWSNDGLDNPNSDYLVFDCYRRPTFEFDIDASIIDEAVPTKHFVSNALYFGISEQRNIRFTVSGKFTAPTGEEFDLLYWKDDVGTIAQQGWQVFGFALNNGDFEVGQHPPTQIPYSSTGDYTWIAPMPGNNYTTFAWRVPNFAGTWQETVTGSIHVKIEDAGEAI